MKDANFIVNVEVAIHCNNEWLIIKRSDEEDHAPGILSLIGGKVEASHAKDDLLIENLKREVYEEIGLVLKNDFTYVESSYFQTDKLECVVDVVFMTSVCDKNQEFQINESEVSEIMWLSTDQIVSSSICPEWLKRSIEKAEKKRLKSKI